MGIGAAMAGGNPTTGRQENDFYPTPSDVTKALLYEYDFGPKVHECACGDGQMARDLEECGYEVIATDLVDRGYGSQQDFLKLTEPLAPVVITNPPFSLAVDFIVHALDVLKVDTLALLLKSTFWYTKSRFSLFQRHPPVLVAPLLWRPDFMGLGRPTMECTWIIWENGYDGETLYKPLIRPQ